MPRKFFTMGLLLAGTILMHAVPATAKEPRLYQDGDRVAVIGDSITQSRRTHSYVWLYYATRFPDRKISFANCGISGDTASGAVRRFDWDIAIHKPTIATIMLGMNDVGRGNYSKEKTGPEWEAKQKASLDSYKTNMIALSQKLKDMGCEIIYQTPSPYDQTGNQARENNYGVNDALGKCGEIVRELAKQFDAAVIDLHAPMTEINTEGQKSDPAFTIIGADRIHPGDDGQFIMAYLFLKQQGCPGLVSKTAIDAAAGKVTEAENAQVSDLQASPQGVTFVSLEAALPCYVPAETRPALKLLSFEKDLNQEILQVTGLAEGKYEIAIDDGAVATATAAELAAGVNLAGLKRTPMLDQSREVWNHVRAQQVEVGGKLRRFAEMRHHDLNNSGIDINDYEAVKAFMQKKVDELKAKGNSMAGYQEGKMNAYVTNKPKEQEIVAKAEAEEKAIYETNKPKPHRFAIRPASAAALQAAQGGAASTEALVDGFDRYDGWTVINWSNVEAGVTAANGIATFRVPRRAGERDMWGASKGIGEDITGMGAMNFRLKADKGAHVTVEINVDGQSSRIANYVKAMGDWETMTFPLKEPGKLLKSVSVVLCEPGAGETWDKPEAVYEIDRIWMSAGTDGGAAAVSEKPAATVPATAPAAVPAAAAGATSAATGDTPSGGQTIDDFDRYEGWKTTSWTNTEAETKEQNGAVTLILPRTEGQRDMYGIQRSAGGDLGNFKTMNLRFKADKGSPIGIEIVVNGQLKRLISYNRATGDWQTVSSPVEAGQMTSLTIILAESGDKDANPQPTATYELDRLWLE